MSQDFFEPPSKLWSAGYNQRDEDGPIIPSYGRINWDELDSDEVLLKKPFHALEEVFIVVQSYITAENFEYANHKGPILPKVCSVVNRLYTCLSAMILRARDEEGNEPTEMLYLYRLVSAIVNNSKFRERYDILYPADDDSETISAEDLDTTDGETTPPSTGTTASLTADDYPYRLIGFLSRSEAEHFVSDSDCPIVSKAYLTQVKFTLEDYGLPDSTIKRVLAVLSPTSTLAGN